MPEVPHGQSERGDRRSGSHARPVSCSHCMHPVDPLRAARVAVFHNRFRYFCSADCRASYNPDAGLTPLPLPRRTSGPPGASYSLAPVRTEPMERRLPDNQFALRVVAPSALGGERDRDANTLSQEPGVDAAIDRGESVATSAVSEVASQADVGALLLALALLGGLLGVALVLAGDSSVAMSSRAVVVAVSMAALLARYFAGQRDASDPHPVAILSAPCIAVVASIGALATAHPAASQTLTLAGIIIACTAGGGILLQRARRVIDVAREQIAIDLGDSAQRVLDDEVVAVRAMDLRPGEEIVVGPGEVIPVDISVIAGSAKVHPWAGAGNTVERGEGDWVVAGASVVSGRLRGVVGWVGYDRAWLRLTNDPRRRADLFYPLARLGRLIAERFAPAGAGLAALTAYAANQDFLGVITFVAAAQAAIATFAVAQVGALVTAQAVLSALRRGVAFRTPQSLDRAGRVSSAVFCARGTLLLGEPEVANIEVFGDSDAEKVLGLLAGAESGATHPVAVAIQRAARARGVRPDGVRSPTRLPGLGVTAVASSGKSLVVGSRGLMLQERVSVASAESTIIELESTGRSVLLVALGGRLVGAVGLQDGLRSGSRAAVQHLLDVGVEPVLVSGDSRETCEALGRVLDIEHLRPEVLPAERGDEVRRLADGGATVAVVGRSPGDDGALSAADVSVVLSAAGATSADWDVQLASDDVRDAAFAIRVAHRLRSEATLTLGLTLGPGVFGVIGMVFSLVPAAAAPLLGFAGLLAGLYRLRSAPS